MTAGTDPFEKGPSDSVLVARVLGGDRTAFATVYDRYADRLYDFAHSMLRNPEDASDAVADAFIKFAERLPQLREPERLRPWLYAIVRTECLRRLKSRSRIAFGGDEPLIDMPDTAAAPDEAVETAALRQLVWDAAAGLGERDRALLDLHLRQGLDGAELGDAMGVSASNAYVMMNRVRSQMERSLGALLIAKTGRDDCSDLDSSLTDWDGSFSPLVRKRVARHVDNCPKCTLRRAAMVSPLSLFAGVSAFAAPSGLRERVLNNFTLPPQLVVDQSPWLRRGIGGGVGAAIVVVLVALVVATAGEERPETRPVDASSKPTAAPTLVSPSPSPSPSPSATTITNVRPPVPSPARLVISDHSVKLSSDDRTTSTTLSNRGGRSLTFDLDPDDGWLSVDPNDGHLDPGESTTVTVSVSRGDLPRTDDDSSIDVDWTNGSDSISVRFKADEPDDDNGQPSPSPPDPKTPPTTPTFVP